MPHKLPKAEKARRIVPESYHIGDFLQAACSPAAVPRGVPPSSSDLSRKEYIAFLQESLSRLPLRQQVLRTRIHKKQQLLRAAAFFKRLGEIT